MSTALVNPIDFPAEHNVLRVGTGVSPGRCEVKGFKRVQEFDVKKGKGTKGATITFTQKPPAEGEITFYLWDNGTLGTGHNHFQEWGVFLPLLKYDPTKKDITAINVYHPVLADLDVNSLVCTDIGQLERTRELMWSVTCKFLEYTPQPKASAVGTAKKSSAGAAALTGGAAGAANAAKTGEGDAPTEQEKEVAKLWDQFNDQGKDAATSIEDAAA